MTFGERLKEERRRLGLSQTEMGDLAGVAKTTQLNYEKGARSPDAAYLSAIASAGVDVLYVLTGQRTPGQEEGLDPREQVVLGNYRALSKEDQASVQRLTYALAESKGEHKVGNGDD